MTRTRALSGIFLLLSLSWAALVSVRDAGAYSAGIDGYSGNPADNGVTCNECHAGGIVPTVVISGPTSVGPGETNTYLLTVGGGQERAAGLDVSASDGMLSVVDPGTYLIEGEITHSNPRLVQPVTFEATFSFNWTAPLAAGSYTLYGAGNSVNLASGPNGDRANTDMLVITVGGAATPGEASAPAQNPLLVTDFDPSTGELVLGYDAACESTDHDLYYGELSLVASHAWSGEVCGIGTAGVYAGFDPGPGSYFFVVVGNNGADEGSYGRIDPVDGPEQERPPYAGNGCGETQDLTAPCD